MFDFREIEAFVWIVRLGSFRQAAQTLHLTQPSISERIARLEDIVGKRLLDRGQRPIVPTIAGRQFYHHAVQLLESRHAALETLKIDRVFQGVLRLGVVETIVHSWLPCFVAELSNRFPDLTIQLVVDGTPGLCAKLLGRQVDMVFALGPVTGTDILSSPLCSYATGLIVSPRFGLDPATFRWSTLEDQKVPLVTFASDSRPYRELWQILHDEGLNNVKLHCSSSAWTIVRLALASISVGAAVPLRIVHDELSRGELMTLPCVLPDHEFYTSWPAYLSKSLADGIIDLAVEISREDQAAHAMPLTGVVT